MKSTVTLIEQLIPENIPSHHAYRSFFNQLLADSPHFEPVGSVRPYAPLPSEHWSFGPTEHDSIRRTSLELASRGRIGQAPVAAMLGSIFCSTNNRDWLLAWTRINAHVLLSLAEQDAHSSHIDSICRLFRRIARESEEQWVVSYLGEPGDGFQGAFDVLEATHQRLVDDTYWRQPLPRKSPSHILEPVLAAYKRAIGRSSVVSRDATGESGERTPEAEPLSSEPPTDLEKWLNPRGRLQHIARREHYFSTDMRYLAISELQRLGSKVYSDAREGHPCGLIACMSLHTGTRFDLWVEWLALPLNTKPEKILLSGRLEKAALRRGYELPDERTSEFTRHYLPGDPEIVSLPLPYSLVRQFLTVQQSVAAEDINRYLSDLRSELMLPVLSPGRIRRELHQVLRREVADRVIADILCGTTPKHSPALNYVNYSYDELLDKYREAIQLIFGQSIEDDSYLNPAQTHKRVGSKSTLTLPIVKGYLATLLEHRNETSDVLVRMNLHSVWLWHVMLLLTASRVVRDYPGLPEEIDLDQGWWWVSDKEERGGKTVGRLIPLCPFLVTALHNYRSELLWTLRKHSLSSPHAEEYFTAYSADQKPWLAVWDTREKWQPVSHKFIIEFNKNLFPQPKNWTRHVARQYLINSGLAMHLIDAIFGHESADTEALNPYSSVSLADLGSAKVVFQRMAEELELVQPEVVRNA